MPDARAYPQLRYRPPAGATTVVLVRHGASEAAVEGEPFPLAGGHGDPALAEVGRAQAERVAERLGDEPFDALYVTSLRRTVETAAPLARRLGLTPVVEADLREVHLGEWEGGLFRVKVETRDPVAVRMLAEQRWDVVPGAEAAEAFAHRVRLGVERIAAAHPGGRVVVVCHGGVIAEVLRQACGCQPFAFTGADNGSISEIVVDGDRWTVRRFNEGAHLRGL